MTLLSLSSVIEIIMENFLFEMDSPKGKQERKHDLYNLWRCREKKRQN